MHCTKQYLSCSVSRVSATVLDVHVSAGGERCMPKGKPDPPEDAAWVNTRNGTFHPIVGACSQVPLNPLTARNAQSMRSSQLGFNSDDIVFVCRYDNTQHGTSVLW